MVISSRSETKRKHTALLNVSKDKKTNKYLSRDETRVLRMFIEMLSHFVLPYTGLQSIKSGKVNMSNNKIQRQVIPRWS
jgi:hypothetical protein